MKQKIHDLLHKNKYVIKFIYGLIVFNVIALVLESYKELRADYGTFFEVIELFSVVVFSVEYILRIWVADLNGKKKNGRLKFAFSWLGIIDLIAVLPFYLPMLFPIDLRVVRILRLLRLMLIFKLGRFSKSLKTMSDVLKET